MITAKLLMIYGKSIGTTYELSKKPIIIGRDKDCDIRINDHLISRRHCSIEHVDNEYIVKDLESKNGISVNGVPVDRKVMKKGDKLRVGRAVFILLFEGEDAPYDMEELSYREDTDEGESTETIVISSDSPLYDTEAVSSEPKIRSHLITLYETGKRLGSITSLTTLIHEILDIILKNTDSSRAAVLLMDMHGEVLHQLLRRKGRENTQLNISKDLTRRVFENGEAILRHNIRDERSKGQEKYSAAYVPIESQKKRLGILYLDTYGSPVTFNHEDIKLFIALCSMSGPYINNIQYCESLKKKNKNLQDALEIHFDMVGKSMGMQEVFTKIGQIADTRLNVLITGESGTGKELVARAIHYNSSRRDDPFICINCGAVPASLMESELFGHERGSFTGAVAMREGKFEMANDGTLFLDEIGELDASSQIKLLRVLEEKKIQRLGGNRDIRIDVRLLAATNKVLEREVASGKFRKDLYFRIKAMEINLPPLRERKEDIPLLAEFFADRFCYEMSKSPLEIDKKAMDMLISYNWPGNVRELKNCIEQAIVISKGSKITPADLSFAGILDLNEDDIVPTNLRLKEVEQFYLQKALRLCNGNKTKAAQMLGIDRKTLNNKLVGYDIDSKE